MGTQRVDDSAQQLMLSLGVWGHEESCMCMLSERPLVVALSLRAILGPRQSCLPRAEKWKVLKYPFSQSIVKVLVDSLMMFRLHELGRAQLLSLHSPQGKAIGVRSRAAVGRYAQWSSIANRGNLPSWFIRTIISFENRWSVWLNRIAKAHTISRCCDEPKADKWIDYWTVVMGDERRRQDVIAAVILKSWTPLIKARSCKVWE